MSDQKYQLKKHPKYGYKYIDPAPTLEEIENFYRNEFYSSERPNFNDSALAVQTEDQAFYNYWRNFIAQTISTDSSTRLNELSCLDIGCGWGETLRFFLEKGVTVAGADPSEEAVNFNKKHSINVKLSDFTSLNPFGKKFNFVLLQNVLEHLNCPDEIIDEIKETALLPNGYIVIDVPNEFNKFQVAGQKIHQLDQWWVCPPAHLNYFSATSLENLLQDKGFTIVEKVASFPLEMFLLMGHQYVGHGDIGKNCHNQRVAFEQNLIAQGEEDCLIQFYRSLAEQNLGRQTLIIAKLTNE